MKALVVAPLLAAAVIVACGDDYEGMAASDPSPDAGVVQPTLVSDGGTTADPRKEEEPAEADAEPPITCLEAFDCAGLTAEEDCYLFDAAPRVSSTYEDGTFTRQNGVAICRGTAPGDLAVTGTYLSTVRSFDVRVEIKTSSATALPVGIAALRARTPERNILQLTVADDRLKVCAGVVCADVGPWTAGEFHLVQWLYETGSTRVQIDCQKPVTLALPALAAPALLFVGLVETSGPSRIDIDAYRAKIVE